MTVEMLYTMNELDDIKAAVKLLEQMTAYVNSIYPHVLTFVDENDNPVGSLVYDSDAVEWKFQPLEGS